MESNILYTLIMQRLFPKIGSKWKTPLIEQNVESKSNSQRG